MMDWTTIIIIGVLILFPCGVLAFAWLMLKVIHD